MYDLCLISVDENESEINELQQELNLLGMRTVIEDLNLQNDIKTQLEAKLDHVSSVLLLITTSLSNKIIADNVSCKKYKSQICIVYFSVKSQLRKKTDNLISEVYSVTSRSVNKLALEILKSYF